jgi:hypothetical protein
MISPPLRRRWVIQPVIHLVHPAVQLLDEQSWISKDERTGLENRGIPMV